MKGTMINSRYAIDLNHQNEVRSGPCRADSRCHELPKEEVLMNELLLELQRQIERMWLSFARTCPVASQTEILEFSDAMDQAQEITDKLLRDDSMRPVIFGERSDVRSMEWRTRQIA